MERRHDSGPRRGFGPRPPVKEGEILEVAIEAVGEKGDGVARKDGFVLFVPGVKEGDHVKVKVTRVLRKVGFAEVVGEGAEAPAEEEKSQEEGAAEEASEEETPAEEEAPEEESGAEDTEDFGEEAAEEESSSEDDVEVPEPPEEEPEE